MAKRSGGDTEAKRAPNSPRTAGRQRQAAAQATPRDLTALAHAYFGTAAPATDLQSLLNQIAAMKSGESAEGKGTTAVRARRAAGASARTTASALRRLDMRLIVDAMGRPASVEASSPLLAAVASQHRLHRLQWFESVLVGLDRLSEGLVASAGRVPRLPRGRPRRSPVLTAALEGLELLWWQYRTELPTQSTARGGFMALAQEVLTRAPCSFAPGSVQKAVRAYLGDEDRPTRQLVRPDVPATPPPGAVLVIGADDPALGQLAVQYAAAGAQVVATAAPDRVAAVRAEIGGVARVVGLSLTCIPGKDELAALGAGRLDVMVLGGIAGRAGVVAATRNQGFEDLTSVRSLSQAADVPAVLHAVVRGLRKRLAFRNQPRLVVVTSHLASAPRALLIGDYGRAPVFAAIQTLVGLWARDMESDGVTVVAMHLGWGLKEDHSTYRLSAPEATARVMAETIGRVGQREHGKLIDLNGGIEP